MASERDYFLKAHNEFQQLHEWINRLFTAIGRENVEPRRARANLLFFRLGMVGNSLLTLCVSEMRHHESEPTNISVLDDSSIASLGRTLLETCVMFMYISEPAVSEDEWLLREAVLELHGLKARHRMAKHCGLLEAEPVDLHEIMSTLEQTILANPILQRLDAERQKKVLAGGELYINGRRGAIKEAGFDVEHFEGMYVFLSNHAHAGPVSFHHTGSTKMASGVAPDFQYRTSGLALEYGMGALDLACQRMFHLYPAIFLTRKTKH
jgi:hypothetical protein